MDWNVTESVLGGFDLALLLLEEDLVGVEAVKLAAPGTTRAEKSTGGAQDPTHRFGTGNSPWKLNRAKAIIIQSKEACVK